MSQIALSRELALRIGLAARAMPGTDAKSLLTALTHHLGLPITEKKLVTLSLQALKTAFSGLDDNTLLRALGILKDSNNEALLPPVQAYQEGDMPGSVRIACASDDAVNVDGHFGSCRQFMVYQISAEATRLIDIRHAEIPAGLVVDDKNAYRAELIQDCKVVYMASVGGPAAAKIVKQGLYPIKLERVEAIADIVSQLQDVIAGTPPPWLAKIIGLAVPERNRYRQEAGG
ncbi:MAG: dinitrogenase iron-molybdenum cofactor biosynthesis protein [Methylovulum sp.]|nr:dinitrogenase iron-molybdenum cofactor biosynthesis protein [Methylovulum sp.]